MFPPVQRRVGDDPLAVESEDRHHLLVVELHTPALDDGAVVDAVPRESPVGLGQMLKELVERADIALGERAQHDASAVAEHGLLRESMRHGSSS